MKARTNLEDYILSSTSRPMFLFHLSILPLNSMLSDQQIYKNKWVRVMICMRFHPSWCYSRSTKVSEKLHRFKNKTTNIKKKFKCQVTTSIVDKLVNEIRTIIESWNHTITNGLRYDLSNLSSWKSQEV